MSNQVHAWIILGLTTLWGAWAPVAPSSTAAVKDAPDSAAVGYLLLAPTAVSLAADGTLAIEYQAPCKEPDFETFAGLTDDSGDMEVRVVVAIPRRFCAPGPVRTFQRTLRPSDGAVYQNVVVEGAMFYQPIDLDSYEFTPADVVRRGDGLELSFQAPCTQVDFETVLAGSDDSGDFQVAVGVLYAKRDCTAGQGLIARSIDSGSSLFGLLSGAVREVTYAPMRAEAALLRLDEKTLKADNGNADQALVIDFGRVI